MSYAVAVINFRLAEDRVVAMDAVRGGVSRSDWIRGLIDGALAGRGASALAAHPRLGVVREQPRPIVRKR